MFLMGLPLLGLSVAIAMILVTGYLFWRHIIDFRVFFVFEAILTLFIVITLFPQLIDFLMGLLNVGVRGLFVLTVGLLGAYLSIYSLYVAKIRQERMIIKLFQEISLLRYQIEHLDEKFESHYSQMEQTE